MMQAWESTPRIAFLSPEPASGKTRSLEVTELLAFNPVCTINATPAYIFRKVGSEDGPPSILFDEIDTVFGKKAKNDNEDVRALLNSGHRRGATAGRCIVRGQTVETEELPSYAAVALAGLGWLPDTILSRSIIIRMRRRASDEVVEPFRRRVHAPLGESLRTRLAGWAGTVIDEATVARPDMPNGVEDRLADAWEPLLAISDIAGGQWPERARTAAVSLIAVTRDAEPSLNIRLLADIRTIFSQDETIEAMATKQLLAELHKLDDSPWAETKDKKPILNASQLAWRLRQYEVGPKFVRINGLACKGYLRADLYEPWRRYLPPLPEKGVAPVHPLQPSLFKDLKQ
jgi:hypothetical protein